MKPFIVGIAGGTGSGKSTIAEKIREGIPDGACATLDHDSYYCEHPDLNPDERALVNYDHPDALDNALLIEHLDALRNGQGVDVPIYDFVTHSRSQNTRRVEPRPIVVVEGILTFVDAGLRDRMDCKIFVDTDADIRVFRRIRRDMEHRGRSFQQIREQYYKTVRPMHLQFVEPSKRWADIIIPEGGNNSVALDMIIGRLTQIPKLYRP
ncbi:MAG: uridine kinase [Myxococcota bacterium]